MKNYLLLSILAILLSCSDDDDTGSNPNDVILEFSNFSIVSFDDDAFYEFRFTEDEQEGFSRNLTEEEGISRLAFFTRRIDGVFGFYGPGSVAIKDFRTEQLTIVNDLGGNPGEERITATNDNATLGLVFTMPGTPNFFIRVIDIASSAAFTLALGVIDEDAQLFINGNDIFVVTAENNGSRLIKIDKSAQAITGELNINDNVSGLVFGESQDVFVFNTIGGYINIAIDDLSMLSTTASASTFIPCINTPAKFRNGVIYSDFQYPQPSEFAIGPAAYDLSTGDRALIDVASIFTQYATVNDGTETVQPVHFDFDTVNNVWVVAFQAEDEQEVSRYGYFVITTAGEIIQENPLERLPWSVVVYN